MISILRHPFSHGHIGPIHESRKSSILQSDYQTEWKKLYKKPYAFFTEEFQSNWESKTGMLWREWGKLS